MNILIADDHAVVREGVKRILMSLDNIEIIDESAEGFDALNKMADRFYDLVILDISMPGVNGLDILRNIHSKRIQSKVIVLSLYSQMQYAIHAINLGAYGYISKDIVYEELNYAIKKIIEGEKYLPPDIQRKITEANSNCLLIMPTDLLTKTELKMYALMVRGKSDEEIAESETISENTARNFRVKILKKIGVKNQSELILYANRNKYIN